MAWFKSDHLLPDLVRLNEALASLYPGRGGVAGEDFRPGWDGFLVNCYLTILPAASEQETRARVYQTLASLLRFVADHQALFYSGDQAQLIVGWDERVRTTGRQILKKCILVADAPRLVAALDPEHLEQALEAPTYPGWCRCIRFDGVS